MGICRTDAEIVSGACGWVRADGRAKVHIHAEIVTEGGSKIALAAGGVAVPEGVIERLSAAASTSVDIEPPGVLVGEPFGDLGLGDVRLLQRTSPRPGIRRLAPNVVLSLIGLLPGAQVRKSST